MRGKKEVKLIKPKPFEVVGLIFNIIGEVPKAWLQHKKYAPYVNWYSASGNYLPMSGPLAEIIPSFFSSLKGRIKFQTHINLFSRDPEHPQGIIIEISGDKKENFSLFPFIINGTNRIYDCERTELKTKLSNSVERIKRLKRDWETYRNELEKLSRQKVWNNKIIEDIFQIVDGSQEGFPSFTESDEDKKEKELAEKYAEAIRWEGPLLGGRVGRMAGFDFCVYSTDHKPEHLHIIHKERGIDARFSYPKIELIDYVKRPNTIGSKEVVKIKEYFEVPENRAKLEAEFKKQILT